MAKNMTLEEHIERHQLLHSYLDELVADWINMDETRSRSLSKCTILELLQWSNQQTKIPEKKQGSS